LANILSGLPVFQGRKLWEEAIMFAKSIIPRTARAALCVAALAAAGPALADGQYVYTNDNQPANTVTTFSVASNGNLTNLGQIATGDAGCGFGFVSSRRATISKNGDFLLASNDCGTTVSVFSGASAGKLVLEAAIPVESSPGGVSIGSDGKCLVFGFVSGDVSSYLFPTFTPVNTVSVGAAAADMKIGKPGPDRYVAAVTFDLASFTTQIAVIPLSPSNCALGTPEFINTSSGGALDFSSKSDILYVSDLNPSETIVEAFAFPAGTPLTGSPFVYTSPPAGMGSNSVLVSKDGRCLFVGNPFSSAVSSIPLSKGIPGATATAFPAGLSGLGFPTGTANDVTGKRFYVASAGDNTVTTEIIGAGCALTEAPSGPVGTGVGGFVLSLTASP
jgi:hypothetical protein